VISTATHTTVTGQNVGKRFGKAEEETFKDAATAPTMGKKQKAYSKLKPATKAYLAKTPDKKLYAVDCGLLDGTYLSNLNEVPQSLSPSVTPSSFTLSLIHSDSPSITLSLILPYSLSPSITLSVSHTLRQSHSPSVTPPLDHSLPSPRFLMLIL
jgi:hypothetical protein